MLAQSRRGNSIHARYWHSGSLSEDCYTKCNYSIIMVLIYYRSFDFLAIIYFTFVVHTYITTLAVVSVREVGIIGSRVYIKALEYKARGGLLISHAHPHALTYASASKTSAPCPEYVLSRSPLWGFHSRTVLSLPHVRQ